MKETTSQRAVSRLRRTNDRSVSSIHEDHEDDENAENGVVEWSQKKRGVSLVFLVCVGVWKITK
jgi:hypothetical protein